jgi:hypothetical protein
MMCSVMSAYCQITQSAPLELVQTFSLPAEITGSPGYVEVDVKRNRLFIAGEDSKAVLVLDADAGKVVRTIVLETLSAHPHLRRIGLHAIPSGSDKMVVLANEEEAARNADAIRREISEKIPSLESLLRSA